MARKKPMKFYGNDWTEVSEYLGIPPSKHPGYNQNTQKANLTMEERSDLETFNLRCAISKAQTDIFNHEDSDGSKKKHRLPAKSAKTLKACRAYAKSLSKASEKYHYEQPLWEGLSKIKHNGIFLKYFQVLLPFLWT